MIAHALIHRWWKYYKRSSRYGGICSKRTQNIVRCVSLRKENSAQVANFQAYRDW